MSHFFRSIPNILSYDSFRATCQEPGIVYLKEFSDSNETQCNILKPDVDMEEMYTLPNSTDIPGLGLQRQWYLYEQIRPQCKSTLAADLTCPEPSMPKSQDDESESSCSISIDSTTRKRTCSVCHNPGHNKRTCPSK